MKFERAGGILLHPTSLPGPYGIGDLGPAAHRWVDWLSAAGCKLWQVLPLGPTGYGDSPYQCFSAFAGNPYLISPELLLEQGLLVQDDFTDMPRWDPRRVDFGELYRWKPALLEKAFRRFPSRQQVGKDFDSFRTENAAWLDDFALFMAIKAAHGGGPWQDWPEPLRKRQPAALEEARKVLQASILRFAFFQFLFFHQWQTLREYAHRKGLRIIGDAPIFVAMDSSDVWANQRLFHLDAEGRPTVVAGVPPDYFSPTGQLWGNPLYRWEAHQADGYAWWRERLRAALGLVDILRLDHFRGFAGYWEIPAGSPTAETGRWVPGPGADFFETVLSGGSSSRSSSGVSRPADEEPALSGDEGLPIIAEDLGVITPDVTALRDQFGFPGMKVLQFAFSGPDNLFLPEYYPENCVVYTGTHDNDTTRGWYESAPEGEREFACRYLKLNPCEGSEPSQGFAWDLIRLAWDSAAVFALAPMQDFLNLGSEARMNFPSRLGGNWAWRMTEDQIGGGLQARVKELNRSSQR